MREADLTAWLRNPETQVLLAYLHQRRAATVQLFLSGHPVDPVMQGRAAALHELEKLLTSPQDVVRQEFEKYLKGIK